MNLYSPDKIKQIASKLKESINNKKLDKVEEILRDQQAVRGLILARGRNNEYLKLLEQVIMIVLNDKDTIISDNFFKTFKQKKFSKIIIFSLLKVYFHLRDKKNFLNLVAQIEKRRQDLGDGIYYRSLHDLACWRAMADNDFEAAIDLNGRVIKNMDKNTQLYWKAKYGNTLYKDLMPKQKIADFALIAEKLEGLGVLYDALRARIELARLYCNQAHLQGLKKEAFENLNKAKDEALRSLKLAKDMNYTNSEIMAAEALSLIYAMRQEKLETIKAKKDKSKDLKNIYQKYRGAGKDDGRKAKSYAGRAEKIRSRHKYKTISHQRFKKEFFKHTKK